MFTCFDIIIVIQVLDNTRLRFSVVRGDVVADAYWSTLEDYSKS